MKLTHGLHILLAATVTLLAAVVPAASVPASPLPGHTLTAEPPPVGVPFDYQLGGPYPPPSGVGVVIRDRTAAPAPGLYNVCYVNAYQTQPGEAGAWPAGTVLTDAGGAPVRDPDWEDEHLLDTRTEESRAAIAGVVRGWLRDCAARGYQAVEPDNLDSWTRSRGLLTEDGNVALAALIAADAHELGLAVAQKNAVELVGRRAEVGWDFAVVESCHRFGECQEYIDEYDGRVVAIEYPDEGGLANFAAACREHGDRIAITYRDRDVTPAGSAGYVYRSC